MVGPYVSLVLVRACGSVPYAYLFYKYELTLGGFNCVFTMWLHRSQNTRLLAYIISFRRVSTCVAIISFPKKIRGNIKNCRKNR